MELHLYHGTGLILLTAWLLSILPESTQADPPPTSKKRCGPGQYVTESTGRCEPCPAGKFQPYWVTGGPDMCKLCTMGFYCSKEKLARPEGPCKAGYYCPPGSKSPTELLCDANFHCPEGIGFKIACPGGRVSPPGSGAVTDCVKKEL